VDRCSCCCCCSCYCCCCCRYCCWRLPTLGRPGCPVRRQAVIVRTFVALALLTFVEPASHFAALNWCCSVLWVSICVASPCIALDAWREPLAAHPIPFLLCVFVLPPGFVAAPARNFKLLDELEEAEKSSKSDRGADISLGACFFFEKTIGASHAAPRYPCTCRPLPTSPLTFVWPPLFPPSCLQACGTGMTFSSATGTRPSCSQWYVHRARLPAVRGHVSPAALAGSCALSPRCSA
jgi:hypothetical protein